ncbi:MAG: DoxX family protein [Bacteroidetes bacterium]|nr:DoxX family protein [Bacteroidota bacterium]
MKVLLGISRFLVGGLFIFSGLIKANDPYGFAYKLQEYFAVFDDRFGLAFTSLDPAALTLSILICTVEIVLGFALILGVWKHLTAWSLLLMILFFTWLTGWSSITGTVTDCGCFGDAIPITPDQSFYKDLILLVFIGFIFIKRRAIHTLLSKTLGTSLVVISLIGTLVFAFWNLSYLPMLDFRPYKVGNNIPEEMSIPEDAEPGVYEIIWIYSDNGVEAEYTDEDKPWENSNLTFVDRNTKVIVAPYEPRIHDLIIIDENDNDITDELLNDPNYNFILVSTNVKKSKKSSYEDINALVAKCDEHGIAFNGLTASIYEDVNPFRHEVSAAFPFHSVDATTLKTIIRSNPGLLLLKGGTIIAKWPYRRIPSFEKVNKKYMNL